jgi:hypothetical protein
MMKSTATLLLIVLIITQTPAGQLLRLPLLIEHFCKHNKHDGVSMLKFLKDHYTAEDNDADRSEDKQLPFKTMIMQSVGFALLPNALRADFALNLDSPDKIIPPAVFVPRQHSYAIFRPPRA